MATTPTQIRIDADIKEQTTALFNIEMPCYSQRTLDAMDEARRISRNPDVKGYSSMEELQKALEE